MPTEIRSRPIIFSAEMVRAILDNRKTQTRRVMKPQPHEDDGAPISVGIGHPEIADRRGELAPGDPTFAAWWDESHIKCHYGAPGDRLCYNCGYDTHNEAGLRLSERRLHGGERRENLQPQAVSGIREVQDRAVVSTQRFSKLEGISPDFDEPQEQADHKVDSSADLPCVSRKAEAGTRGAAPRRESGKQRPLESMLGNTDRAVAGPEIAWPSGDRRETPRREVQRSRAGTSAVGNSGRAVQPKTCGACPRCGAVLRCGDRLWVREKWRPWTDGKCTRIEYAADGMLSVDVTERLCHSDAVRNGDPARGIYWRSPIHMPRWASRITLEITGVCVDRVQEISESDAVAEGVKGYLAAFKHRPGQPNDGGPWPVRDEFEASWDSINAKRGYPYSSNPWVWVIGFKLEGRH